MMQRYGGSTNTTIPPSCHLAYHMYGILVFKASLSLPWGRAAPLLPPPESARDRLQGYCALTCLAFFNLVINEGY